MNDEDIKFRYVFSGSLTDRMHDMLLDTTDYKPFDALVSQLDRSSAKKFLQWKKEGFIRWLFIDSGAFSVHTGKADTTQEEYIEYINSIIDDVDVFAQLDTIPGKFGQPKSENDYIESAENSWENFLHMRNSVKDKYKVMPVYHFGEDTKYLKRMLDYVDEDGDKLDYIGLSPANDASISARKLYLKDMYDIIKHSSNPNVKTHVYGFTSLDAMSKFPCYSADSISHRLIAGYNKIYTQNFGIISTSDSTRSTKNKSSLSFKLTFDEYNKNVLRKELESIGINKEFGKKYGFQGDDPLDWLGTDSSIRTVVCMKTIQILSETTYKYNESNLITQKKLF